MLSFLRLFDVFVPVTPNGDDTNADTSNTDMSQFTEGMNKILGNYKALLIGIFGIATLSLVALLIYYITKLGAAGGNPEKRNAALQSMLYCGIAIAVMGSLTVFFGIFFYVIN
jgi:hypothetical protein